MAAEQKRDLVARGAPNVAPNVAPNLRALSLHSGPGSKNSKMDLLQQEQDRIDSGFGDSFKSEGNSRESKCDSISVLEEITSKMEINDNSEQLVCDDASTNNRHPEPCSPPKTIAPSPKEMPHHASPIQSVMNFAQCNDVRYLLAPYRQHLLVQNEDGDTPIHLAIIHSLPHIDAFVSIVPSKDCLNIFNYLRQTPLHLAVITRQPSVVSLLLHAGASIDLVDRNGKTALHLACERGDVDIIRILTQFLINTHGSDSWAVDVMLNARDYKGFSALHLAVMTNGFDAIGLLVSLGANIDLPDGTSGRTAVHLAVENNNLKMLNYLLYNCNASVNAQRFDESTALHIAAGRGMLDLTARLLVSGADLSITNSDNETPLDHASPEILAALKDLL